MPRKKSENQSVKNTDQTEKVSRKGFLRTVFSWGGLIVSYGFFGGIIIRYLMPAPKHTKRKLYVSNLKTIDKQRPVTFSTPEGESYILTIQKKESGDQYLAFSNRCPHLGCKVLWNNEKQEFFCPCHGGVFNSDGVAIAGPPGKANQVLKKCEIEIVDSAIYAIFG